MNLRTDNNWTIRDDGSGRIYIQKLSKPGEIVITQGRDGFIIEVYQEGESIEPEYTIQAKYEALGFKDKPRA